MNDKIRVVSMTEEQLFEDCPWMVNDPDAIRYFADLGGVLVPSDKDGNVNREALNVLAEVIGTI